MRLLLPLCGLCRLGVAVYALAAPLAHGADVQPPPNIVDRLVSVVEGEVITQSALELEARVALILAGDVQAAERPLEEAALRAALELSIGERLQVREAERLQTFDLEPGEVEGAFVRFRDRFSSMAAFEIFLAKHEVEVSTLGSLLARKLRAEKLLDSRVRLRAQVPENEVRAYHEAHLQELGEDYPAVRPSIREKLYRERYRALVKGELDKLRQTAQVRVVANFALPTPQAAP